MLFNRNFLNIALIVCLVGVAIWVFADIVVYILVSLVLSGILKAPTNYISQAEIRGLRLPRSIAIFISFGIFLGIISLFLLLFIPLITEQIQVIASIPFEDLFESLRPPIRQLENILIDNGIIDEPKGFILLELKGSLSSLFGKLRFTSLINYVVSATGNLFVGVLAVVFITFFILFEKGLMRRKIIALIPNKYFEVTISAFYKIERLLSNYLLGLLMQILSIFTLTSFGLIIIDVKYAVTIGLFCALINVIPFVGPTIGTLFALVIGLSTAPPELLADGGYFWLSVHIFSVSLVVHLIDNVVLQPLIFSKSVKAHPLEIFITVFAGATLGGVVGMVVAIPCYTILRVSFWELRKGYREYRIFQSWRGKPS